MEEEFAAELEVVGVPSGKYQAERITDRIRHASFRLKAEHPIINDRQFRVWRSYAVSAWPTLVVLDPAGYVVGAHAGEFTAEMLGSYLRSMISAAESKGTLDRRPWLLTPDASPSSSSGLRYPGKVAVDGSRIAISDSGNRRVLVGNLTPDGKTIAVTREIGAVFDYPQGLCFHQNVLYVADAGNHSIMAIDLDSGSVSTVAGSGRQLRTLAELEQKSAMSSPWDIAIHNGTMFIAMAGIHEVWAMDLSSRALRGHAGTGTEDIRDGLSAEALLAQPMGIAAGEDGLYYADAESSAIRVSDYSPAGSTRTIIGTGLFDFGDVDGTGDEVRMQHQQGISIAPDGRLLVADSYNDSLKWVDPKTRSAKTWIKGLNEPGGVTCGPQHAYVADTNAHRIVKVGYGSGELTELRLQ
jgi:sugar lactone lactonase YvrE